jgi:6-phosphogluconolactonase (cycloisomerase 2 family)
MREIQERDMRTMGIFKFVPIGMLMAVAIGATICGCGPGASTDPNGTTPGGATPTITSLSPTSTIVGGPAFPLTVVGSNFVANSVVRWNGGDRPTTFVGSGQLTAQISASDVVATGTAAVTVFNPAPGGGTSNAFNLAINTTSINSTPSINSLDPSCAPVGGQDFTLLVSGSDFVASSVVRWNGSDRPTTLDVIGPPVLRAQIPASDIAAAGTAAVTVFNPAPGGGSSNTWTLNIGAGGAYPQSIAVDPTGKFAYVANMGCLDAFAGNVSMYKIDPTTGLLTSIGSPVASAGFYTRSVTIDPSGKFAYVANAGDPDLCVGTNVSTYTVSVTTGELTSIGTIEAVAPCSSPWSVAVDPSGKFAYVANEGGYAPTSISMYTINATTGALTSTGTIVAGGRATWVAVHPSGNFAYVANGFPGDSVSIYTINATTGTLTSTGAVNAGSSPSGIAIDPSGKFAYVANSNSNDVSMYTINPTTGGLTPIGLIAAGTDPASVAVDPTGKFIYATNSGSNDVSMYTIINATTGALMSIGTIAAELSPSSIAIHPSGKFAYVTNQNSHNVSMYSIDVATGNLTLIGTIGT